MSSLMSLNIPDIEQIRKVLVLEFLTVLKYFHNYTVQLTPTELSI